MKKKYAVLAVATASALSLTLAASAFAQTTVSVTAQTAPSAQNGQGRGGPGGMRTGVRMAVKPGVAGKVTAVNGTSITVSGRAIGGTRPMPVTTTPGTKPTPPALITYTVDASGAAVTKGTTTSTVSAIAVGDQVFVEGTVNGTSVAATAVRDGMMMRGGEGKGNGNGPAAGIQGNGQPVVAGSVTSVSGSTFTLTNSGNASYTVDATSAIVRKGNATSTVANIATGDTVIVQGTVNGTSISATSVFDQGAKVAPGTNGNESGTPKKGLMGSIGGFFKKLFGF